MNITVPILLAQYQRARRDWPFIETAEAAHGLPALLLYAVGSRESNLRNVMGDRSQRPGEASPRFHGFGVWQRDSGAFGVDESYLDDVRRQADDAAALLADHHSRFGRWDAAVAAYNCGPGHVRRALDAGEPVDLHTAGRDYAADVLARHAFLVERVGRATAPSGLTYTVRAGDTLSAIAARHHTTVAALAALNQLANPNALRPGQVLRLPGSRAPAPRPVTYTVRPGDTLSRIALRLHTTVAALVSRNGIKDPDHIAVGQVLRLP